jgi:hypothetical protein
MSQLVCKNCGEPLSPSNKFCPNCGAKVEQTVDDQPAPAAQVNAEHTEEEEKPHHTFHIEKFDWNTEGYPDTDKVRKTQDINFDWNTAVNERIKERRENGRESLLDNETQNAPEKEEAEQPEEAQAPVQEEAETPQAAAEVQPEAPAPEAEEPAEAPVEPEEAQEQPEEEGVRPVTQEEINEEVEEEKKEAARIENPNEPQEDETVTISNGFEAQEEGSRSSENPEEEDDGKSLQKAIFGYTSDDAQPSSATDGFQKESTQQIDKFYTFSKKNEEFQNLLDQEYNRLKTQNARPEGLVKKEAEEAAKINAEKEAAERETEAAEEKINTGGFVTPEMMSEGEKRPQPEMSTEEAAAQAARDVEQAGLFGAGEKQEAQPEPQPQVEEQAPVQEPEQEQPEAPEAEAQPQQEAPESVEQQVNEQTGTGYQPEEAAAAAVAADAAQRIQQAGETVDQIQPQQDNFQTPAQASAGAPAAEGQTADGEKKLTFQDVFDDEQEKAYPKHTALHVIAIIILIIILLEVAAIIIRRFAPDSSVGQWIGQFYNLLFSKLTGQ